MIITVNRFYITFIYIFFYYWNFQINVILMMFMFFYVCVQNTNFLSYILFIALLYVTFLCELVPPVFSKNIPVIIYVFQQIFNIGLYTMFYNVLFIAFTNMLIKENCACMSNTFIIDEFEWNPVLKLLTSNIFNVHIKLLKLQANS